MQLIVDKLSVARANRMILRDISLSLSSGEALILRGPNGSGKTTLIRAIAGFLPLASGSIRLEGVEDGEIAEHCHFVGHRDGIKGALTAEENARFFAEYLGGVRPYGSDTIAPDHVQVSDPEGLTPASTPATALARLGLDALADVPAAWLSAGQRRRLGLSRLLLARRPLWLLDEPTVSLDAASVETLAGIIAEHIAGGGMAIAATHIPLGLANARELHLGAGRAQEGSA